MAKARRANQKRPSEPIIRALNWSPSDSALLMFIEAPTRFSPMKRLPWLSTSTKPSTTLPGLPSTFAVTSARPTAPPGLISERTATPGRSETISSGRSRPRSVIGSPDCSDACMMFSTRFLLTRASGVTLASTLPMRPSITEISTTLPAPIFSSWRGR